MVKMCRRCCVVLALVFAMSTGGVLRATDYSDRLYTDEVLQLYSWDRLVSSSEEYWLDFDIHYDLETIYLRVLGSGVGYVWSSLGDGSVSGGLGSHTDQWDYDFGGGNYAIMQSDGNFVLYRPNAYAMWATGTSGSGSKLAMQDDGNLVVYNGSEVATWSLF